MGLPITIAPWAAFCGHHWNAADSKTTFLDLLKREQFDMTLIERSPLLMSRGDSCLLVIDVQEKLAPLIPRHAQLIWNIGRLVRAAQLLNIPCRLTEQYPRGLGSTVKKISDLLAVAEAGAGTAEKRCFSCLECSELLDELEQQGLRKILLCGIESHVCVQQTALDLLSRGWGV